MLKDGKMNSAIKFEHVSKTFPGVNALTDVSFEIQKGEVHALLGENGAGKSTLLNILHGILTATSGKVYLDGQEVAFKTPNEAIQAGIYKVHQEINVVKDLTVGQNITLGYELEKHHFIDAKTTNTRVNAVLERLHCRFRSEDMVYTLTAGDMQMIAIAKALYHNSKVISFDEPTASLTNREVDALFSIIHELRESGISVIYVSHRLEEIFRICDRATILRDGKYVTTVNVADINRQQLVTYMAGREIKATVDREEHDFTSAPIELKVSNFSDGRRYKDVSFELRKGEILGFYGLVGAGRTELMRALIGADKKRSGTVTLEGQEVNIRNTKDSLKQGIGLLPEERKTQGFVKLMSNLDNTSLSALDLYTHMGFVDKAGLLKNFQEKAHNLRLTTEDPDFLTVNLSGGNQQKIILARWLSAKTRILIFDEPTKGIDVATKVEIYKLMQNAVKDGKSIILISSELPEILAISDRIIVMYEGKITAVLNNTGDLKDNDILGYAMGDIQK